MLAGGHPDRIGRSGCLPAVHHKADGFYNQARSRPGNERALLVLPSRNICLQAPGPSASPDASARRRVEPTDEHRAPRADATHSGGAGRRCLVLSLSFSATRGPCHQGAAPSWLSRQPRSRLGLAGRVFLRAPSQAPSRAGPQLGGATPPSRLSSVILTWPPRRCARDLGFSRV